MARAMERQTPVWVAVVGDNTIDRYGGADGEDFVGGNAVNVAVGLADAGIDARYFGAIGADAEGELIRSALGRANVGLHGLVTAEGRTALTIIRLAEGGERVFESEDFGVTADYYPSEAALDDIAEADWVHIGMITRADELRAAIRARRSDTAISQDCAVASGFSNLDLAFGSVGEAEHTARTWAETALAAGARRAVVTRGAHGSLAADGNVWWTQRAEPTTVVDTTGAGDSFIAGFIACTIGKGSMESALRNGAMRAAATCAHPGGFPQPAGSSAQLTPAPDGEGKAATPQCS